MRKVTKAQFPPNEGLRQYRTAEQLSPEDLAKRLRCSPQMIRMVESGFRRVSIDSARKWEQRTGGKLTRFALLPHLFSTEIRKSARVPHPVMDKLVGPCEQQPHEQSSDGV